MKIPKTIFCLQQQGLKPLAGVVGISVVLRQNLICSKYQILGCQCQYVLCEVNIWWHNLHIISDARNFEVSKMRSIVTWYTMKFANF